MLTHLAFGAAGVVGGTFLGAAATSKLHTYLAALVQTGEKLVSTITNHTAVVKAATPINLTSI